MPTIDSRQFLREIKTAKNFHSIYLFIGEEETLISESLKDLKTVFFSRYGNEMPDFNFENIYGEQTDSAKIIESCTTLPFGADKKLVVLHHFEKLSESSKSDLKEYCASPNASTCLVILWNVKPNQQTLNHEISTEISKAGMIVKCWKPFESDRPQWIREEVFKRGKKISSEACSLLSEEGGESLSELKSEIEKLDLYTGGKNEIQANDVKESMSFRRDRSLWDFVDSLESDDIHTAGQILEFCLEQGEEPVRILSILSRSFKKMSGVESFSPYRQKEKPIKKMDRDKLFLLLKELKKSDLLLKTGHDVESAVFEKLLFLTNSGVKKGG